MRAAIGDGPPAVRAGSRSAAVPAVGGEVLGHQHDLAQRRAAGRLGGQRASTSARTLAGAGALLPLKEGMAQKPQMRSQPSATLT